MNDDSHLMVLLKGGHRYVFMFDHENRYRVRHVFGKFASDRRLNFSWYDAARMCQRVEQLY